MIVKEDPIKIGEEKELENEAYQENSVATDMPVDRTQQKKHSSNF